MSVYKIQSSHFNLVDQPDFVGDENRLFYKVDGTNVSFYISDGFTPGGTPLSLGGATEAYVDARIAEVIDGAGTTLDTLNELAQAIGNDDNFAQTIQNALNDKLDLSNFETQFDINLATAYNYGSFFRNSDFTYAATNTPYIIPLEIQENVYGTTLVPGNLSRMQVNQDGIFTVTWTVHYTMGGAPGSEGIWYTWLRRNGTDVPNSMRRGSVDAEAANGVITTLTHNASLAANDYIEICTAVSSTDIRLDAEAPAFGPQLPAMMVTIEQIQI